jgi:hypothetical protein
MAAEGYEDMPDYSIDTVTIDSLLRGFTEKQAALVNLNKDPRSLNEAMHYLKSEITNQQPIGEVKKRDKINISFNEYLSEEPNIRMTKRTPSESSSKSSETILESGITKLDDQLQKHTKFLQDIIRKLQEPNRRTRSRSLDEEERYRYPSPSKSDIESLSPESDGEYFSKCQRNRTI